MYFCRHEISPLVNILSCIAFFISQDPGEAPEVARPFIHARSSGEQDGEVLQYTRPFIGLTPLLDRDVPYETSLAVLMAATRLMNWNYHPKVKNTWQLIFEVACKMPGNGPKSVSNKVIKAVALLECPPPRPLRGRHENAL